MSKDDEYSMEPEYEKDPADKNAGSRHHGAGEGELLAGERFSEERKRQLNFQNEGELLAGERFSEERERSLKLQNDEADENLIRKRWGRGVGLAFMSVFSLTTICMIFAVSSLANKLITTFSIRELVPTPFHDSNIWSHVLPMLPVFSLSLIALLMFITLARFTTDFINEERRESGKAANDDSDEAAAIRVLKKILALCGGK